jgi:hypothetical protein
MLECKNKSQANEVCACVCVCKRVCSQQACCAGGTLTRGPLDPGRDAIHPPAARVPQPDLDPAAVSNSACTRKEKAAVDSG